MTSVSDIIKAIEASGYKAELEGVRPVKRAKEPFWLTDARPRIVIAAAVPLALAVVLQFVVGSESPFVIGLLVIAAVIAGHRPARASIGSLRELSFDENVLMTVAVVGAFILQEWLEAATVMFLFAVGTMLEAYTMERTRHAIHALLEIAPSEATVKYDGEVRLIPVEDVNIGDTVVIKPGERIPVDGEVVFGRTSVNQAAVTGESLPVFKEPGNEVFAGTLNNEGYIEVRSTKLAKDTTIAHIIHLVEEAQAKKAPSQRFITRFSAYYTPIVISTAVAVAILPPLFGGSFSEWFYRALVLLVISCPCALVISTPVAIASAIGAASRTGVLIKGGAHLEMAGSISTVVFDKTGTLTTGRPAVTDVVPLNGYSEDQVITITASMEARSGHPLAEAVVNYAKDRDLEFAEPSYFESMPGLGVKAQLDGTMYYAGNPRLFAEMNFADPEAEPLVDAMRREGKTVFLLGTDEKLLGIVAVADKLREDARVAVRQLHEIGIANVVMLTGDNKDTAREIASQVGITDYRAELLPQDKVAAVETISQEYGRVAMVGDGVNDAPALSRADIGIAMGAVGSDIALETADIALMGDELRNIPYTIKLSRRGLRIIKQNVATSILVKLGFILLGVGGVATLWMAVFADTGVSILVILNGMRLFRRNI